MTLLFELTWQSFLLAGLPVGSVDLVEIGIQFGEIVGQVFTLAYNGLIDGHVHVFSVMGRSMPTPPSRAMMA